MSSQPIDPPLLMLYATAVIPRLEDDRVSIHPGVHISGSILINPH